MECGTLQDRTYFDYFIRTIATPVKSVRLRYVTFAKRKTIKEDFQGANEAKIKLNFRGNVEDATIIPNDLLRVGNGILVQILKRFTSDYVLVFPFLCR